MKRALAIETAAREGSVALAEGGTVVAEAALAGGMRHAAGLLPLIEGLMRQRGWTAGDLDHLYVSVGPGSFTGLRIGITLAKTLALASGVKLVAVPTLAVVVENAPAEADHAVVVIDAKRDQVFAARFERTPDGWAEREPAHIDRLADVLRRAPRPVCLIGEGVPFHRQFLPPGDDGVIIAPEQAWRARANVVACLGSVLAAAGRFVEPDRLLPTYIRQAEAEEKLDLARAAAKLAPGLEVV